MTRNHLVAHHSWRKYFVDSHYPTVCGIGLFKVSQLEVFVANNLLPHRVIAGLFLFLSFHFAKPVVNQLVHKTIEHGARALSIDLVLAVAVKRSFFDLGENSSYKS